MIINFNEVKFLTSYGSLEQIPQGTLPEVVFAGRSNVGKSSLINKLFNRKGLAKVSSKPGKTATINFYGSSNVHFVDLPGYGYAQAPKAEIERWSKLIDGYLNQDRPFATVCSLIDIRHDPSKLDHAMVEFLQDRELPYTIVLTKADKISKTKAQEQNLLIRDLLNIPEDVTSIITSSDNSTGIEDLRAHITHVCS